jgi:uncharacterized protein YndB with AHSA1/START domain
MTQEANVEVVVRRRILATPDELFDAWTNPESMRQWMCPGDVISSEVRLDPRVGGRLYILMRNASQSFEHNGEFKIVERPSRLVFSWIGKHLDERITLVTVEFVPISSTETELVLTHQYIPKREGLDAYQKGWTRIAELLERHLQTQKV